MKNLAYTEHSDFIHPRLVEHSKVMEQKIYKVGHRMYSAVGYGLEYPIMIEGDDGIIIIDPAETVEMMDVVLHEFRRITDKPVKAVILSHSHGDHWGGIQAVVSIEQARNKEVLVIAHESFEQHFAQQSGELLDIRLGRAVFMYGSLLPIGEHGYVNLGCGPVLSKGTIQYIQPNTFVSNEGLTLTISGVHLTLFHLQAETDDAICLYLSEDRILFVGDAIQGEIFPNLYTIRGQSRDAKKWYTGIDILRKYTPKHLVGTHMRPLSGEVECMALLTDYRDAIQYTHDQATRMINKGYTPDYAIQALGSLPPHLFQRDRLGEFYGTFKQGVRAVYDMYLGWFNGESTKLNPMYPDNLYPKYIEIMGGRDHIISQAKLAIESNEFAWAAEILSYVIKVNPKDEEARHLKAKAVRATGYATENATWRNWYLTVAMALDGSFEKIVKEVGPNAGFPPFSNSFLGLSNDVMFESIQVKVDGLKAANVHIALKAHIEDNNETFILELRRGILQVHKGELDMPTLTFVDTNKATWAKIVTKEITILEGKEAQLLKCETPKQADDFFSYFEGFTSFTEMPFWLQ